MTIAKTRQTQRLPEHWHFDQTGQPIPTFADERQARLQLEAEIRRRQSPNPQPNEKPAHPGPQQG